MKNFAVILTIFGTVGLFASFFMTIDVIKLSADPNLNLPCNISPFISCGSVIESSQGKIFGFPNPLLGIVGFTFVVTTGALMLFGAQPSDRFWKFFTVGIILAEIFVHWLIYESIFVLGNLCLYCMVTWAALWPVFIFSMIQPFNFQSLNKHRYAALIGWHLLIILLILLRFREYFLT